MDVLSSPVAPYLTVHDARGAIEFYKQALGARELSRMEMPNTDKLMHAALEINGGLVMLSDDFPEMYGGPPRTPNALGGTPVTVHLSVPDIDAIFAQAIAAGATAEMSPADMFWGDRFGVLVDPYGHRWSLSTPIRQAAEDDIARATSDSLKN